LNDGGLSRTVSRSIYSFLYPLLVLVAAVPRSSTPSSLWETIGPVRTSISKLTATTAATAAPLPRPIDPVCSVEQRTGPRGAFVGETDSPGRRGKDEAANATLLRCWFFIHFICCTLWNVHLLYVMNGHDLETQRVSCYCYLLHHMYSTNHNRKEEKTMTTVYTWMARNLNKFTVISSLPRHPTKGAREHTSYYRDILLRNVEWWEERRQRRRRRKLSAYFVLYKL